MSSKIDQNKIEECLLIIQHKLGWGRTEDWHNEVFQELSQKIEEETRVLLSPTTLKRVWGRLDYKNSPSISTLNALSQFAGFANWREFKGQSKVEVKNKKGRMSVSDQGIIITSAALLTIVFISFFSLIGTNQGGPSVEDLSKVEFSSQPLSEGLPNTVVFDLDLGNIKSDSLKIQQYWDPSKTIELKLGQKQATGIYYFPGYFRAKLLVDNQIIREHDLYIKSGGWMGMLEYEPIPKYIKSNEIVNENLSFPPSVIEELKSNDEPLISSFHYIEEFEGLSGDNFSLETSIRNVYRDKWAVCQNTYIFIIGTKGAMIIPFSIAGCVSDLGIMLSDVYISGKENDLSSLAVDFSTFRKINIDVVNKNLSLSIDGKVVNTASYSESIGEFAGIRFKFLGAGEVEYVKILDQNGHTYQPKSIGNL
ncbi:MAG: hypothetical protein OCD76_07980 [Reichenbachiella sp.]